MNNLSGKKVLITGGSSGIGKATAIDLVGKGAIVCITGRNKAKLEKVASEINAIPIHLDVSKYNSIAVKTLDAFHTMGGIDVLINNAGIGDFAKLEDIKVNHFESIFATNVFGLTMLTQEVVKFFKTQQYGMIINIGSSAEGNIHDMAIDSKGRIILVGDFSSFNGDLYSNVVRINSDGSTDKRFQMSLV